MRPFYILIGALVIIGLVVIVFLSLTRPNTDGKKTTPVVVLADFAGSNASVSYTLDGITRGNELHRSIKITITNTMRKVEVFSDYQGKIVKSQSFVNNVPSFKAFLAGLQTAGYLKKSTSITSENYLGQCPLGYRYIFNTDGIKDVPSILWTTSCSTSNGTFKGILDTVRQLFTNQIPGYEKFVSDVRL